MTGEQPRNTGEEEETPSQPSNPDENSGEEEETPNQPSQGERGDGSKLTEAESMERELSPVWSELRRLRKEFGDRIIEAAEEYLKSSEINGSDRKSLEEDLANLKSFLDTVVSGNTEGTKGTEGLEIMIKIAFGYIQRLGINDDTSQELAGLVVQIAGELKAAVDKIADTKFSYETKKEFLEGLISLIVKLILSVGPNYFKFRGRKPEISGFERPNNALLAVELISNVGPNDSESRGREPETSNINHPNNALLTALDEAAYALVDEAAAKAEELNNHQELINTISSLLEMTKKLLPDELKQIYDKILLRIRLIIMNSIMNPVVAGKKVIDSNLIEQLANWYANYFARSQGGINQFITQLLALIPPDIELEKILSKRLYQLYRETRNTEYWNMALRLNGNIELEERIAGLRERIAELRRENAKLREENAKLREEIAGLRERIAGLELIVQILLKELVKIKLSRMNTEFGERIAELRRENAGLEKKIAGLRRENAELRERIAGLEVKVQILLKKLVEIVQGPLNQTGTDEEE